MYKNQLYFYILMSNSKIKFKKFHVQYHEKITLLRKEVHNSDSENQNSSFFFFTVLNFIYLFILLMLSPFPYPIFNWVSHLTGEIKGHLNEWKNIPHHGSQALMLLT